MSSYHINFLFTKLKWRGRAPGGIPIEGIHPQQGQTTTPGTPFPALFEQCVGSFSSRSEQWRVARRGLRFIRRPYPRRLECLTICRCNYKCSTFYSVNYRPLELVRRGLETHDLPHGCPILNQNFGLSNELIKVELPPVVMVVRLNYHRW